MDAHKKITDLDADLIALNLEQYLPVFDQVKRVRNVIRDTKTYEHQRHYDYPYVLNVNSIDFLMNIHLVDPTLLDRTNAILAKIGYKTDERMLQLYRIKSDVPKHIDKHRVLAMNHVIVGDKLDVVYEVDNVEHVDSLGHKETSLLDTQNPHGVINVNSEMYLFNCSLYPL